MSIDNDEIYSDYGDEADARREVRDAADDAYLEMLRSIGFSSTPFYAYGGLFESAFKSGFIERADALVSIGGPGMGRSGKWTAEAKFELANVGTLAYNFCRNLFPTRHEHSEFEHREEDPRAFNRTFEKEAKEAKRVENLAVLEKLIGKGHDQHGTHHHSLLARKTVFDSYAGGRRKKSMSKGSEKGNAKRAKRAKTWHGSLFAGSAKKNFPLAKEEKEDPNGGDARDVRRASIKGLVRRVTGSWRGR